MERGGRGGEGTGGEGREREMEMEGWERGKDPWRRKTDRCHLSWYVCLCPLLAESPEPTPSHLQEGIPVECLPGQQVPAITDCARGRPLTQGRPSSLSQNFRIKPKSSYLCHLGNQCEGRGQDQQGWQEWQTAQKGEIQACRNHRSLVSRHQTENPLAGWLLLSSCSWNTEDLLALQ